MMVSYPELEENCSGNIEGAGRRGGGERGEDCAARSVMYHKTAMMPFCKFEFYAP